MNTKPRECGFRLVERDGRILYTIGRLGAVTIRDLAPLFWGSEHTARHSLARLRTQGLVRMFGREDPSNPGWFSLTPRGAELACTATGCDSNDLRIIGSIQRRNRAALRSQNCLWVSLVIACRKTTGIQGDFIPEAELRRQKTSDVAVVPDALVVLVADTVADREIGVMVEFDSGLERLPVWVRKSRAYVSLRHRPNLYGVRRWVVLAAVTSERRARRVAEVVVAGGAGTFTFVAIESQLHRGQLLDHILWRADRLTSAPASPPSASLIDLITPASEAGQRTRPAAGRPEKTESGVST
jgi:Replication-relaxation